MRSGCRPTEFCRTRSATCSSVRRVGRLRRCAATIPASATGPAHGQSPRRVVAKVEWHPGELYPRVGFIVTNLARPAERIVGLLQPPRHRRAVDQRRARAQSSGPAYHAAPSPRMPSASRCMLLPTTWATSCGRWRCRVQIDTTLNRQNCIQNHAVKGGRS